MGVHPQLNIFAFLVIAFLPATIAFFLASAVWIANKRPLIAPWRITTFNCALGCALADMILFLPNSAHFLVTQAPATGIWLVANWIALSVLVLVLGASLTGKGWSRGLLFCWGLLLFLGVFMVYATVP